MTTRANIYVDRGTTFITSLDLVSNDDNLFAITDQTFYCGVRKLYSTTPLFSANVSITAGPPVNDVTLSIEADQTRDLEPGKYQYDVLMIENDGSVIKILEGLIIIVPTITSIPG